MPHIRFEEPVTVLVGMGLPARIESVMEAYALLQEWPAARRNGAHAVALNACKAGLAGEIDAETVRATFVAKLGAFAFGEWIIGSAETIQFYPIARYVTEFTKQI